MMDRQAPVDLAPGVGLAQPACRNCVSTMSGLLPRTVL